MNTLDMIEKEQMKSDIPEFRPGDTVRVSVRIIEGEKERIQDFEGVVIRIRRGNNRSTFTVRKISYGIGVERIFPLHSPRIAGIKVVRRGRVRGVHPVLGGSGEIVEAEALETARVVGQKLRDVELPDGVRVGVLVRGNEVLIPTGDTEIRPGDKVVMFALKDSAHELQNLFRVSMEYF